LFYSLWPPRPPRPTLFPYTTLFRSVHGAYPAFLRSCALRAEAASASCGLIRRSSVFWICCWVKRSHSLYHGALMFSRARAVQRRSEEHTSELQSLAYLVCRLLLEQK